MQKHLLAGGSVEPKTQQCWENRAFLSFHLETKLPIIPLLEGHLCWHVGLWPPTFFLVYTDSLTFTRNGSYQLSGLARRHSGNKFASNAGDTGDSGSTPESGRSPGGHGDPLQYACLESSMDRGAWRATVHGAAESRTRLKWLSMLCMHRLFVTWFCPLTNDHNNVFLPISMSMVV